MTNLIKEFFEKKPWWKKTEKEFKIEGKIINTFLISCIVGLSLCVVLIFTGCSRDVPEFYGEKTFVIYKIVKYNDSVSTYFQATSKIPILQEPQIRAKSRLFNIGDTLYICNHNK